MIGQKIPKPTARDERRAYELATERDNNTCVRCLRGGTVQRDHRQNRQSGNTITSNLQCLCPRDHAWKSENPTAAILEGYAVPRWIPTDRIHLWPARRWVATDYGTVREVWVLYSDDGSFEVISDVRADELMNT